MQKPEDMLTYLVREPKVHVGKPPLIILLHGVGSNEHDLFTFSNSLPDRFLVVSARGPYTLGKDSYGWFQVDFSTGKPVIQADQAENSRQVILQFMDLLKEQHPFNEQQVYICGFSQGGIMAYSVALTRPDVVAGIAVMSGRILSQIKPLVASAEKLKSLRVFISHGTSDPVLSIQYARDGLAYLKELNLQPAYHEYDEGHTVSYEMLQDLVAWLSQR
jgi:phospholipase/carboxylesterase